MVKARSQVGQTCFFFCAGDEALALEAAGDWDEDVEEEEAGIVSCGVGDGLDEVLLVELQRSLGEKAG